MAVVDPDVSCSVMATMAYEWSPSALSYLGYTQKTSYMPMQVQGLLYKPGARWPAAGAHLVS